MEHPVFVCVTDCVCAEGRGVCCKRKRAHAECARPAVTAITSTWEQAGGPPSVCVCVATPHPPDIPHNPWLPSSPLLSLRGRLCQAEHTNWCIWMCAVIFIRPPCQHPLHLTRVFTEGDFTLSHALIPQLTLRHVGLKQPQSGRNPNTQPVAC